MKIPLFFKDIDKLFETVVNSKDNNNLFSMINLKGRYLMLNKYKENFNFEEEEAKLLEFLILNQKEIFNSIKHQIINYLNEIKNALQRYLGNKGVVREVELQLKYKGSFGVGSVFGQMPFEVGLHFHPYFNVPYIPASSIKGAIRNAYYNYYILRESKAGNDEEKIKKIKKEAEELCNEVFGDSKSAGLVGFTDAFPIEAGENGFILYPDIINPHYKDKESELDVQPVPIIFLTVAPGTKFKFYIYIKKERKDEKSRFDRRIMEGTIQSGYKTISQKPEADINKLGFIDVAVLYGLALGVGAKTSLGYSSFEVVKYE